MAEKSTKKSSTVEPNTVESRQSKQPQYPSELIDLPSGGKLYPEGSPLSGGQIEIKYMTAREEDILTSQNLIRKGVVIDTVLDSLILTKGISVYDLFLGDKNAIMVAARILAYGPEYVTEIVDPDTEAKTEHTFDLSDLEYTHLPDDVEYTANNVFPLTLPVSKADIKFRLLNGRDEQAIEKQLSSLNKISGHATREITTRLKYTILEVNGDKDRQVIDTFVESMLSRDSLFLRNKISSIMPDIKLEQEIETQEGNVVKVDIPMTTDFFWPQR